MAAHQLTLSVPATPIAVASARHQAVDEIQRWAAELDDEVVHTAELVISELVTNTVRYAATGQVRLEVHLSEAVLRIEVYDSSPVLPQPSLPDQHSENGRGLFLVGALTDRYAAEPTPTGKRCWAEIALTAATGPKAAFSLPLQRS
ncbi:ATP-binding protein [Streptomyces xiangluensis]|uniref:ATP-binding protein n=1 Tax=Streptomyces xiangluensis TaxID=2665720 RepID=A0ABV8YP82_9ACTN